MRSKKTILFFICSVLIFITMDDGDNTPIKSLRAPASVKDHIFEPKLESLIDEVNKEEKRVHVTSPLWKTKLVSKYKEDENLKSVDIKEISDAEVVFNQKRVKVKKVHMKLERINGDQSSFLAYVDSRSNKVIKSWSHRQDEKMIREVKIPVDVDFRFE